MPCNKTARRTAVFALLAVLTAAGVVLSLYIGSINFSIPQIISAIFGNGDDTANIVVRDIRLPRLVVGILAGAFLSCAGSAMQSLFRNPLADPSITGVSAGAALGAVMVICVFGQNALGGYALQVGALICGLVSCAVVWLLGRSRSGGVNVLNILLTGIAVNAFCGAAVGFMMYSARESGLKSFVFWSLGSLDAATWNVIAPCAIIGFVALIVLYANSDSLNMLHLGEKQAFHSGVNIRKVQFTTMACAAALTAVSVAACGIIGFVGLVVPHILRLLVGADNKLLIPLSALGGAALLTYADIASRAVSLTDAVPIGVITSFIGAPVFLFILSKSGQTR